MSQPSQTNLHSKTAPPGSPVSVFCRVPSQPGHTTGRTNVGHFPALIAILWLMILPVAMVCLVGCTGFTYPKAEVTTPNSATLRIATNALPMGTAQSNYSATLVATGGVPPYSWTQTGGQLPAGLTLNSTNGNIAGAPTSAGTFAFTAKVQDAKARTVSAGITLPVSTAASRETPLRIATTALPVGAAQSTYSSTLVATGGVPPYSWTQAGGQLPTGLALNSATGTIAGTPSWAGSFSFTTRVQDSKAAFLSTGFSLNVSSAPAPTVAAISPNSGTIEGGTFVTVTGTNFRPEAVVELGSLPAQSVHVVSSTEIQAVTPMEPSGAVNVVVQNSDGQVASAGNAFKFTAPAPAGTSAATVTADVVVDASQTVSETGGDDLAAAKNIYASASNPESDGGLLDWDLISSEFAMKRMRIINALGDCAMVSGRLTGCSRLNDNLTHVKEKNLTPHVVVGQWAPTAIGGNPLQWGAAQWAQYDTLSYAIVNYVVNQYGGSGFNEALFEVGNELDITQAAQDLWLTTSPNVPQGDASRFTQYDTVYGHWAAAVNLVAQQNPSKKIRISGPATGFWTMGSGTGWNWQNQIIEKYATKGTRLDVISLHQYGANVDDLAKYAQSVRSTLKANGKSNVEIWITEYGANWTSDPVYGAINANQQGASWAIHFLLQCLKGSITGGSFLGIRDNAGTDMAGANSNVFFPSWLHVANSIEYPKPITNAFSMTSRMAGARKSTAVTATKPDLNALASSDGSSASLVVANYNFVFANKSNPDQTKTENVTVAFKNLPFNGAVTVDRYVIDAQTSNLNYWVAAGKTPPSVQATQLQKVESFSATSTGGTVSLPARQLGQSAVSLWIVHQ